MSNQSRVILITLLLVFAFGAWFLPSQAQRSSQRSAPSGKATPPKSSAAKPTTGLSRASQSKSVDAVEFHAVGFAESPPARDLPAAGNINPGAPDTEGREINELNTESGRTAIADKPSFDGALQDNARAGTPGLPTPALPAPSLTFEGIAVNGSAPP